MGNTLLCRKSLSAAGLAIVLLAPMHLNAQPTPRQVALLPPYCQYTWGFPKANDKEQVERWKSIMSNGDMFGHMHHYCYGLMHRNDAKLTALSALDRKRSWQYSIPEFDYVIRHAPPDFVLLPEFLTMKGESLIALGKAPLAIAELQRAINLKPDYWPPYVAISDYYKDAGEPAKAREWLEKGLSSAPNTKALQNRLAEIDGMKGKRKAAPLPTGEPAAPEPPAAKSAPQPEPPAAEPQAPAGR